MTRTCKLPLSIGQVRAWRGTCMLSWLALRGMPAMHATHQSWLQLQGLTQRPLRLLQMPHSGLRHSCLQVWLQV